MTQHLRTCAPAHLVALSIVAFAAVGPDQARADWPGATRVAITLAPSSPNPIRPIGTGLRNWGPRDEVFIAVEMQQDDGTPNDIEVTSDLYYYECSNNNICAVATLQSSLDIGATIYGTNVAHTSLAVRKRFGQPVEVLASLRQKIELDCDGDGINYPSDFAHEGAYLDIGAKLFSTTAGEIESWEVDANNGSGACENHGISFSRFVTNNLDPMACYTRNADDPNPGTAPYADRLTCNTYDGAPSGTGAAWDNRELMFNDGQDEDHPGFAVYGSADHLALSGTWRGSTQEIRVHLPDAVAAPPLEEIVAFPSTGTKVDYSHMEDHGGALHLVWTDDEDTNASVRYQTCDYAFGATPPVYCDDPLDWLSSDEIVADSTTGYHRGAQGTVAAFDGDRQFVAWQYNASNLMGGERWRVVVASRCVGDPSWSYEEVRTPSDPDRDQYLLIARPALVLNRAENIAHVVFIEGDNYTGGYTGIAALDDSDAWWYRTDYTDCP